MSEREPVLGSGPSDRKPKASPNGVSLKRVVRIASLLAGLVVTLISVAVMLTEGSPHVPFDYGGFE